MEIRPSYLTMIAMALLASSYLEMIARGLLALPLAVSSEATDHAHDLESLD